MGGSLTVTKTWSTGESLTAGDINTSFTEVEAAVTDNDTRITGNTTDIARLATSKQNNASIVTVVQAGNAPSSGNIVCLTAACPATHPLATGGGISADGVSTILVTFSTATIGVLDVGTSFVTAQYGPPTGWKACVTSSAGFIQPYVVFAICTDL